jgi:hypothetical protein
MTSFNVITFKNAISEFQEDSAKFSTQQKSDPLFPSGRPSEALDALLCREDFEQLSVHPSGRQCNTSGHSSVFEKDPDFLCKHRSRKIACNHPDARPTPSRFGPNMKMREAHYAKAAAQFMSGHHLEKSESMVI